MKVILRPAYLHRLEEALDILLGNGADAAAERLAHQALHDVPDRLMQFPRIGRDFLARNPVSPDMLAAWDEAHALIGDDIELREYFLGDYLLLYVLHHDAIHLLALRHHQQAGFDFSQT